MPFVDLTYTRRWNLGLYEHEEFSATYRVEDGEDAVAAIRRLKEAVVFSHSVLPQKTVTEAKKQ